MENEELTLSEQIQKFFSQRDAQGLRDFFEVTPTIDIAEACEDIDDVAVFLYIFRTVNNEYSSEMFTELSSEKQEMIINAFTDKELVSLLNNSFADDVVDTINDMPANVTNRILKVAPKDIRNDINKLLQFKENTAGSLMTTEYIEVRDTATVEDTIALIRKQGRDAETVYTLFVKDKSRVMVGTADLDDLIFAQGDDLIKDIMNRDFVTCNVNDDQEAVANMFQRYDLTAMAVVNNENRIMGIITIDDAVDVLVQEANEDINALSHITPLEDSYLDTSPWKMAKKCFPWIIVLLILGTFTTMALDRIEKSNVFALIPVLICFVPTLMDTGGNAGGQTIALMIRGLGTKEFTPKDIWKILGKESLTALIVSLFIGVFSFIWFTLEQYLGIVTNESLYVNGVAATIWNGNCWTSEFALTSLAVSLTVSVTLIIASFVAKIVAVLLPLGVAALKRDPAVVAQPLLTTIVDVFSLVIYLVVAMGAASLFGL